MQVPVLAALGISIGSETCDRDTETRMQTENKCTQYYFVSSEHYHSSESGTYLCVDKCSLVM